MNAPVPRDYTRFYVGTTHVVAHESCVPWTKQVLETETLYEWASRHPERIELQGRQPVYSVPLPDRSERVVVRRSRHGGLLGPLRGDLFFPPTRAPYELLVSHLLTGAGIRTPPVVAIAVYRAGVLLRRSDVATVELPGRDLGTALLDGPDDDVRREWMRAVASLIKTLSNVGAWHPDLNLRNVLLVEDGRGSVDAFLLDVDRLQFAAPGDPHVREANLGRLERSLRKLRSRYGIRFPDEELRALREMAADPLAL
ncbi:MAG TPA: lipopolysaccharide kinase InaA family protein [Gemmatimonadaceae bacterium]